MNGTDVIHVVPDNELGGGAVNVARLVRALDRPGRALLPRDARPEVRALFADLPHAFGGYAGRGAVLAAARAIRREIRPGGIIHAHGTRAALAGLIARQGLRGARVVYTVRGFHGLARPGPFSMRVRLERMLARGVDATVFVSQADEALARRTGLRHRGPARVIRNGVEAPEARAPGVEAARDIDLLFVGRMVRQKNPQAFVETAARLPGAPRITMIGAGEMAAEIDAMIAARGLASLERLDGLDHAGTLERMARSKLLVLTSRWEGLPTVAVEALLRGCLAAGFEIPSLPEVLGEDAPALLTSHDPEALAARLAALLADDPAREAMAARLRAATRETFSTSRMAESYAALYAEIA